MPEMLTLEAEAKHDCEVRAYVPGYWSDWFDHLALVMAHLYLWRAAPKGKTVEQWLHDVVAAGDLQRKIEWQISQEPANSR